MSPRKARHDEKARIFTPPRPMLNGCILPGPAAQMGAFTGSSVRARTENGRPAWWCKIDKLVVFDGAEEQDIGETNFYTRTSKGLSAARRRGETETVIIPMDCSHCQEMLNRREWKYDIQVCKRSVCWDCGERCRWELSEEHKSIAEEEDGRPAEKTQSPRERADSVLQDEQIREEVLLTKAGRFSSKTCERSVLHSSP
ncbi:hypothetical protein BDV95DRAFT_624617 [Massariosphaeria phaeospora]|uniref:Uncharacterized protein n=1 Tax=Massariosphaeria phaeospora TaxID=100035 RepID=A0A7C8MP00_9PLEO|nr:hypothetical protein BDV95DRAFT_624617 [Massariosphaeria phaeospora]